MSRVGAELRPGQRVRTNDLLAKMLREPQMKQWRGTLLSTDNSIAGCWKVRLDGVQPVQYIHERFLEVENV